MGHGCGWACRLVRITPILLHLVTTIVAHVDLAILDVHLVIVDVDVVRIGLVLSHQLLERFEVGWHNARYLVPQIVFMVQLVSLHGLGCGGGQIRPEYVIVNGILVYLELRLEWVIVLDIVRYLLRVEPD